MSTVEQRLLEEDEDNLLALILHNMIAFMLIMGVEKKMITRKIRRLLGKSHIGLIQTQWIDEVLDNLKELVSLLHIAVGFHVSYYDVMYLHK